MELIPVKLAQSAAKHVKIARLANTIMKLENQRVKIVRKDNLPPKLVQSNVEQCVAMQNQVLEHMKKIVRR